MVCYKRVQNIRELLVKAKLPANQGRCSRRNQDGPNGFKPCREPNCPVCDQLKDKTSVISSVTSIARFSEGCLARKTKKFGQIKKKFGPYLEKGGLHIFLA